MPQRIRIDTVTDRGEADLVVARNQTRGYTSTIEEFSSMRWDGSDLGGTVDVLADVDGVGFLVIGRRQV